MKMQFLICVWDAEVSDWKYYEYETRIGFIQTTKIPGNAKEFDNREAAIERLKELAELDKYRLWKIETVYSNK